MENPIDDLRRRELLKKSAAVGLVGASVPAGTAAATTEGPAHRGDDCCSTHDGDGILVAEMAISA